MMNLNEKKIEEDYKNLIEEFTDDLYDFAQWKMEQLDIEIERQQEILREIKGEKIE